MNAGQISEKYKPLGDSIARGAPSLTLVELQQLRGEIHKDLVEADNWSTKDEESNKIYRDLERQLEAVTVEIRHRELGQSEEAAQARNEYERADQSHLIRHNESFERALQSRGMIRQTEFEKLSLGATMRMLVTGPRTDIERRALAEGADSTGGISVPDITLARFIDKLRAQTVCIRAGAQTLPLSSDKTIIARTTTDPTCAWRSEAGPIAESDPAFEGLTFTASSLAVYFKVSRELLEDSVNVEQALEAALTGALSVELDRVALEGTGTPPEPKGIVPTTNVGSVSVGAAITNWDKFVDGLYEIWVDNGGEPTAIVMHPRTLKTVSNFKEATTNAPLAKPPVLANVPIYRTTAMSITLAPGTATNVILGDFTQLIFGIRSELRIEVLRELFAVNHQYGFVAHLRVDIGLQHPESFCKLTGIVP